MALTCKLTQRPEPSRSCRSSRLSPPKRLEWRSTMEVPVQKAVPSVASTAPPTGAGPRDVSWAGGSGGQKPKSTPEGPSLASRLHSSWRHVPGAEHLDRAASARRDAASAHPPAPPCDAHLRPAVVRGGRFAGPRRRHGPHRQPRRRSSP